MLGWVLAVRGFDIGWVNLVADIGAEGCYSVDSTQKDLG